MSDLRIKASDLLAIDRSQRELRGAIDKISDKTLNAIAGKIQSALRDAITDFDTTAAALGINDPTDRDQLLRGLEAVDRALAAGKQGATLGSIFGPVGTVLGAGIGAAFGAVEGATLEDVRRQLRAVHEEAERQRREIQLMFSDMDRDLERLRAARRRSGALG